MLLHVIARVIVVPTTQQRCSKVLGKWTSFNFIRHNRELPVQQFGRVIGSNRGIL